MSIRTWTILLSLFAIGLGGPLLVAYQLKLGEFAKSPQTVELNLGGSVFVAGGRAKIWFAEIGMGPVVEITCKDEQAMVELSEDEPSQEVCGIRVQSSELTELKIRGHAIPRLECEVTWNEK